MYSYLGSLILKPDLHNTNAEPCFSWKLFSDLFDGRQTKKIGACNDNVWEEKEGT